MNILHLGKYYPPERGGMETHVRDLCEGLARTGDTVTCIAFSKSSKTASEVINSVFVTRICNTLRITPPFSISLLRMLKKLARTTDIVHVHMPNPCAEISCLLARPKRLVVTYHADIVDKPGSWLYRFLQRALLRRADRIIVSSKNYADTSPLLKIFKHKCTSIPYGIDLERFSSPRRKHDPTRHDRPLFLFVGRLVPYKGVSYLIDAMRKVNGTLFIVGNGPLLKRLEAQAAAHKNIHFLTDVKDEELPAIYHSADIFILPSISRAEAFGIVQLEAMACGKPVISTRLWTGVDSVNQHLKTGIIVRPKDSDELALAMDFLGNNEKLRLQFGNAAKKRSLVFSKEMMIHRTRAVYDNDRHT